jgi:hypothetical protein
LLKLSDLAARIAQATRRKPQASAFAALALGFVVVVVGVTATRILQGPGLVTDPGGSAPSLRVGVVPSASAIPSGDWQRVDLAPPLVIADLVPTSSDAGGVSLDSSFVLARRDGTPALQLADRLMVSPSLRLARSVSPDGSIMLRPESSLIPGALYRFTLTTVDGGVAGSWAFQAKQPLHVVTTLPGNETTDVPVDTGIEVVFDQDGVGDARSYFEIEPKVAGRFEQHDRTLVFIPSKLELATVYTVTIRRGIPLSGSDQILERDVRFSFETAGQREVERSVAYLGRALLETNTSKPAIVTLGQFVPDGQEPSTSLAVNVHRFPDMSAAIDALRQLVDAPRWANWSTEGIIETQGLPRVMRFEAALAPFDDGTQWFALPDSLPAGWYLIDVPQPGRPAQGVLQVTDVAAYAVVSSTDTVVWVNDAASGDPIAGAEVRSLDPEQSLGRTDAQGLLRAPTPGDLRQADPSDEMAHHPVLIVRDQQGRGAFAALGLETPGGGYPPELQRYWLADDAGSRYWRLLYTDRAVYRSSDTVNAWGFVRDRESGRAPAVLELRLVANAAYDDRSGTSGSVHPPILSFDVRPRSDGSFASAVPLEALPLGGYTLQLWQGQVRVAESFLSVDIIRKPAYQLEVTTARHVYVAGEELQATVQARFFEGTPVPGVDLSIEAFGELTGRTDATGRESIRAKATTDWDGGLNWASIYAASAGAEEGDISAGTELRVLPSSTWIEASGELADGELRLAGTVITVDLADLERRFQADPYADLTPRGALLAGASVSITATEQIPVRRLVGQSYDFIEKKVIDRYDYEIQERSLGSRQLRTDADGSLRLVLPAVTEHSHEVVLTTTDAAGRTMRRSISLSPALPTPRSSATRPYLELPNQCKDQASERYAVGDHMSLTVRDGSGPLPTGSPNRYLFLEAQRGLRDATVQASPTLSATFDAADAPNITFAGVRFTGQGYISAGSYGAAIRPETRALTVELEADAARYRPGGTATVSVRTLGPDGRPVPATVTLRTVDEKLFAIGAAAPVDPLADLYVPVDSGLLSSYTSHQLPIPGSSDCGGGDTGGGGDGRSDFRDALAFRQIVTDAQGRGSLSFRLSDDLTSWRVSAAAVSRELGAGESTLLLPVGLPFFVEPTIAAEYLVRDHPAVRLRAFGTELQEGAAVSFTLESKSLGLAAVTIQGSAFKAVDVALPPLALGEHSITIGARTGSGSDARSDRVTRRFVVVQSRLRRTDGGFAALSADYRSPVGTAGLTTYVFSDAGRARFVPMLESLAVSAGARVDQALAADLARELLIEEFQRDPSQLPPSSFDGSRYLTDVGQVALLPYAGGDLGLTARVALVAPDRFDGARLRQALSSVRGDPEATRERRLLALAGLASLGDPVLPAIREAAADPELTVRERLYVALAAAAAGDDATARTIERELLGSAGERLGPWLRLRVGDDLDDTIEATSLLALVAAGVGDPLAISLQAYVDANPPSETLASLEQVAFARAMLARLPAAQARFAYTVEGRRAVVDLEPAGSLTLTLTPTQAATLRLEPIDGEIGVATSWQVPATTAEMTRDLAVTIERAIAPAGEIGDDQTVAVTLSVRLGAQSLRGCYSVTDLVPSGLVPVARLETWPTEEEEAADIVRPYLIQGQRVEFCAYRDSRRPTVRLRYIAHVVSTGAFVWEPSIIQASEAAQSASFTAEQSISIVAGGAQP